MSFEVNIYTHKCRTLCLSLYSKLLASLTAVIGIDAPSSDWYGCTEQSHSTHTCMQSRIVIQGPCRCLLPMVGQSCRMPALRAKQVCCLASHQHAIVNWDILFTKTCFKPCLCYNAICRRAVCTALCNTGYGNCLEVVQVWEQEVAWTEADKPIKLAAMALTLPHDQKLNNVPIFCFETMMHMLYWSCLVYDYKRVRYQHFSCLSVESP